MRAGSAGELGKEHGLDQIGFWKKITEHPADDGFLAGAGDGQDPRRAAAQGADDAGRRRMGAGGHLRALAVYKALGGGWQDAPLPRYVRATGS